MPEREKRPMKMPEREKRPMIAPVGSMKSMWQ
jgi:hypothetical protein